MQSTVRSRRINDADFGTGTTTVVRLDPFPGVTKQTLRYPVVPGSQVTDSESHPEWWKNHHVQGDVGGNFFTQQRYINIIGNNVSARRENFDWGGGHDSYYYDGPVYPVLPTDLESGFPLASAASDSDLDKAGATAVARVAPTNAVLNLSTALSEIFRDGFPHAKFKLWEDRAKPLREMYQAKRLGRHTGDDYLNVAFGWAPLIRDIQSTYQQFKNTERIISQYERDAGKMVRRRLDFPVEQRSAKGSFDSLSVPYYGPRQTRLERPSISHTVDWDETVTINRWFSGAFTYYLPSDWISRQNMRNSVDALKDVFDTNLTPETLWNITPWSWAVDWFANTGDVLHNISAFAGDALVMRYGYMMQHTVAKRVYTARESNIFYDATGSTSKVEFVVETKQRRRANPYGFGISFGALSASQKAILGALGLSKGLK